MFSTVNSKIKHAVSRMAMIAIVIIIIVIIAVGGVAALTLGKSSTTSTTSTTPSTTTSSTGPATTTSSSSAVPSTFTYETTATASYLDPQVSYFSYDYSVMQNVYETLLWYNGDNSTAVIPWLAQNYTLSADGKTASFTLRPDIKFQDGETLNSTDVYFSLNRLLLEDSSSPVSEGSQASWILWQLLNVSIGASGPINGAPHNFTQAWEQAVLAQNFVQITGPLTFTLHMFVPNAAFPYLLAGEWADIIAPDYVMSKDLATWSASANGYNLPFASFSGNVTQQMDQYFQDLVSTCNTGITPSGCGTTYLDNSFGGSLAGTGPYILTSQDPTTHNIALSANPNYWGGPYQYLPNNPFMGGQKIVPQIKNILYDVVTEQSTRTIDLESAAKSGQAMAIDLEGANIFDVANRTAWLEGNQLESVIPGVTIRGPYTALSVLLDPFVTNVTNAATGTLYTFQPFADVRMRLAFADAVNMSEINQDVNNKLGAVAINAIAPDLPPTGAFSSSDTPAYSFNPDESAQLLLQAMENPLTQFNDVNGHPLPAGAVNNTFGCNPLPSSGTCAHPIPQTINLYYITGTSVSEAFLGEIASVINNISITYNMGLTVGVVPVPAGPFVTAALAGQYYMFDLAWFADYPWVTDFTNAMYAPGGAYTEPDNMNFSSLAVLSTQARTASENDNLTGLVADVHAMDTIANNEVMYLWTFYPYNYFAMTSNVQGFFYNAALSTSAGGGVGPEYMATLY